LGGLPPGHFKIFENLYLKIPKIRILINSLFKEKNEDGVLGEYDTLYMDKYIYFIYISILLYK